MTAVSIASKRPRWQTIIVLTLTFWLSSSLILDLVIMPELYAAGMISQPSFTTAGYSIFWVFNRIELLCAAVVLTGVLILNSTQNSTQSAIAHHARWAVVLSLFLLATALVYTYALTPTMSALGLQLDLFELTAEVPTLMNQMHEGYWTLEVFKLLAGGALLGLCYRN